MRPPDVYTVIMSAFFTWVAIMVFAAVILAVIWTEADFSYWKGLLISAGVFAVIVVSIAIVIYLKQWHDFRLDCLDKAKASIYCGTRQ